MANIFLVIDPDESRRHACSLQSKKTIAPFPGLRVDSLDESACSVVWALSPAAPWSINSDELGVSFVLGEAIDESGRRQDATDLRTAWSAKPTTCWDGFYLAANVDSHGNILAGVDLLGLMPLYYWHHSGVSLLGTSPEFFLSHPLFAADLDAGGLTRVLLLNGLVGGRTLWKDVRRLQPGHHFRVFDGVADEIEAYRIPDELELAHLPLEGHVGILGNTLSEAVRRHAPVGPRYGLLLSGGLDSRMVGGLLVQTGIVPKTLSIGLSEDLEMRCAKAAAKALGLEQTCAEPHVEDYPECARIHARYEHLANGFNTIRDWWTQGRIAPLGDRIVTGIVADAMLGGTTIHWAYTASPPKMSFDGYWLNMPKLGLAPDVVRNLLNPGHKDLVESAMSEIRTEFEGYGDRGSYQAWRFDLAHGERFHVGATVWRLAFGAWPTLPWLDRAVLKVAAGIPAASLAHRITQLELVRTFLPTLGRVPLDRSDLLEHIAQFLDPHLSDLFMERVRRGYGRVRHRLTGQDSRYWFRINDFNSNHWRTVRREAEPHRARIEPWIHRETLDSILPSPEGNHSGISESARKLLVGFMHWSSTHL